MIFWEKQKMLPNGWKKSKIGETCSLLSGQDFPPNLYGNEEKGLPYITGASNFAGNHIILNRWTEHPKNIAKKGDILLVCKGSGFGITAIADFEKAHIARQVMALQKLNGVDRDFLYQVISMNVRNIKQKGCGLIPGIDRKTVLNIEYFLPPIEEQKKIATTLSLWDSAIEKMEKLIKAKESLLTEYGKELFGKTEQKQNKVWSTIALSEVLSEHGDKSTGKEEVFSVSVHKGLVNQIEHLGRSFAAKDTSNYNRVHYGDIVYTKSPTGDFPLGIVKQSMIKEDVIVSPLYGVFTPQTFELGAILDFYFSSPINANNYLHPVAQKGAKNTINITNKKFLSAKLRLPIDIKEQKKIAQFVQTTKKEMAVLQEVLENYKKQKQGLMQKLLTGQWRVK